MISALNFHFQRFEFVLLQLSIILLTFLVCFGSNQCTAYIPSLECDAMNALNTSFNLPTNITNHANDATNPCSKKKNKQEQTKPNKPKSFKLFFYFVSPFTIQKKKLFCFFNRLERSVLLFFFTNSNNSNHLVFFGPHRNNTNSNWIDDFIAIYVRRLKKEIKEK